MNSAKVAKKYQELRDKAIAKKLESVLEFLDKEQIKQEVFRKLFKRYVPGIERIKQKVIDEIKEDVVMHVKGRAEDLSEQISNQKLDRKIYDEVRRQIKYIFSGVVEEIQDL